MVSRLWYTNARGFQEMVSILEGSGDRTDYRVFGGWPGVTPLSAHAVISRGGSREFVGVDREVWTAEVWTAEVWTAEAGTTCRHASP